MHSSALHLQNHVGKIIQAFNTRDYENLPASDRDTMCQSLDEILEMYHNPEFDPELGLKWIEPLRRIACELEAVDAMISLDKILQGYMGDGVPQMSTDRDKEFRSLGNDVISAWNKGDTQKTTEYFELWLQACGQKPEISHVQADCFPPLLSIAQNLDNSDILSRVTTSHMSVVAQGVIMRSNESLMPAINHLAIDYPETVTIETFMKCNAKCSFCPYPDMVETSPRAGTRMSEELFAKIINDLTDIPSTFKFKMNLSRVNEPLLDHRLFDFMDLIQDKLPHAFLFMPSNGSTLTEKNIRNLGRYKNFKKLMVSLNYRDKATYEKVMGISFDRTVANLDKLHAIRKAEEIEFTTVLSAVMDAGEVWNDFQTWCQNRYPLFVVDRYPPTNWFGMTKNDAEPVITQPSGCKDWYQIHILADGTEAQCCYDAEGKFGHGNALDMHVLDLYNKEWQRKLRRTGAVRQSELSPAFCQSCTYA